MKQIKRMAVLLIAAAFLLLTPVSALAAKQEYVPTKAISYELKDGNWVAICEETYSYTKNARLKAYTYKSLTSSHSYKISFTWKGDFLKKQDSLSYTTTYNYKKKKLKSSAEVRKSSGSTTTTSVSWKKRKGTFTSSNGDTGSITVNKKNQKIKEERVDSYGRKSTTTFKYFANGNLKSESYSGLGYSYVLKYNKKGYPVSFKSDSSGGSFKYKKNKKGQITEQLMTTTLPGGLTFENKRVYSGWKKLSRPVRTCDAFGLPVRTPYSPD